MSLETEIKILETPEKLAIAAAREFLRLAIEAVRAKGFFAVMLSGGRTPKALYQLLASGNHTFRERMPWEKILFFFGDERHVPPNDPDSNFRMVEKAMFSKVPVTGSNIHRVKAEHPSADAAAKDYEQLLREFFQLKEGELPRFDLVLLGMGTDGHTASLFPGWEAVSDRERLVASPWVEQVSSYRITITPPVLCNAACVIFLVSGEEKAETLKAVLTGDFQPERMPAQIIRPVSGKLLWLLDKSAAKLLDL